MYVSPNGRIYLLAFLPPHSSPSLLHHYCIIKQSNGETFLKAMKENIIFLIKIDLRLVRKNNEIFKIFLKLLKNVESSNSFPPLSALVFSTSPKFFPSFLVN